MKDDPAEAAPKPFQASPATPVILSNEVCCGSKAGIKLQMIDVRCPATADLRRAGRAERVQCVADRLRDHRRRDDRHRTSSVLQSWIGTVTAFTASRSPLIVQPRLRDQAD